MQRYTLRRLGNFENTAIEDERPSRHFSTIQGTRFVRWPQHFSFDIEQQMRKRFLWLPLVEAGWWHLAPARHCDDGKKDRGPWIHLSLLERPRVV
jgi:hypothetical protein